MIELVVNALSRVDILFDPAKGAAITAAAMSDPDAVPLTDEEWDEVKPTVRIGRPPSTPPLKVPTTIRFDADVLAALKATGKGWQTRVNEVMREWVKSHRPDWPVLDVPLYGASAFRNDAPRCSGYPILPRACGIAGFPQGSNAT